MLNFNFWSIGNRISEPEPETQSITIPVEKVPEDEVPIEPGFFPMREGGNKVLEKMK
jgi:hypothetical protein